MIKCIVAVFCCMIAITIKAQEIPHEKCPDNATQEEINYCVARDFKLAEHVLDSVYNVVRTDLSYEHEEGTADYSTPDASIRNALLQSQRSWLKYRDDCSKLVKTFFEGGSMSNAQAWTFKTKLTLDRIRELKFLQKYKYGKAWPKAEWEIK